MQWFVYCGIAIGLGMFNLLLYLAIRDSIYFWYVLSLVSMVAVTSTGYGAYGLPFKFLWPEHPLFDQLTWIFATLISVYFPVMFTQKFVDARNRDPRSYRLLIGIVAIAVATAILRLILTIEPALLSIRVQQQLTQLGLAAFAASVLVAAFSVTRLAWRGDRPARMILIAWLPVTLGGLLTSVLSLAAPLGMMMWASAFEFVLMSLALADRFNHERRSREQAQAALVQGLQQSERELEEKVRTRTLELQDEQRRTTQLLHNMLPATVAEELSRTGSTRPRRHESVTILFSDFSGFTQSVATMPAHRMVAELNELFSAFDRIADECGVEKIKTIGDAYMAVAGLDADADTDDHAQRCVRMGLAMVAFVSNRNATAAFKWEVRVGLHSGPVVSGVVGHRKYAFDIWGDSVNVASRMESSGEIGRVNISAYTYDLVRPEFSCRYRGKVEAKGKGAIDMYFVEGVTSAAPYPQPASLAAN